MNVIDLTLTWPHDDCQFQICHNGQIIDHDFVQGEAGRIKVDTQSQNCLVISNTGQCDLIIDQILMFDLGRDKLKYLGWHHDPNGQIYHSHVIVPGGNWRLSYQYPVFSWLHKTLDFGWLIRPDAP